MKKRDFNLGNFIQSKPFFGISLLILIPAAVFNYYSEMDKQIEPMDTIFDWIIIIVFSFGGIQLLRIKNLFGFLLLTWAYLSSSSIFRSFDLLGPWYLIGLGILGLVGFFLILTQKKPTLDTPT